MTSLQDRYVQAVVRSLPRERRESAASDLHGLLDDEIGRRGGGDDAERETLTEMGDPRKIAQEIEPHRHRIVGAEQYPSYVRVMRDALLIVVPVVMALGALTEASVDDSSGGSVVVAALVAGLWALVAIFLLVTIGFVLVERLVPARQWTLDDLPAADGTPRIAFADVVLESVAVIVAFGLAFWQQRWPPIGTEDGASVPLLQEDLWDLWLWVVLGLCIASVVVLVLAYRRGRWTRSLAVANLVVDLAIAAAVVWLAATDRILNPAAEVELAARIGTDTLPAVPTVLVAVVVGVALFVDAAGPLRAARR